MANSSNKCASCAGIMGRVVKQCIKVRLFWEVPAVTLNRGSVSRVNEQLRAEGSGRRRLMPLRRAIWYGLRGGGRNREGKGIGEEGVAEQKSRACTAT
ncbi:hypothetical protein E2C01_083030 [Portunus trituberculatus]|uniref:Uncharacterized protein n=1 Tax=Portunus trituberculatus TaxID=210409 RepID=A0A5B7J3F3_PORTR|nr:hypothetical protein [Portunus trituberculatus]